MHVKRTKGETKVGDRDNQSIQTNQQARSHVSLESWVQQAKHAIAVAEAERKTATEDEATAVARLNKKESSLKRSNSRWLKIQNSIVAEQQNVVQNTALLAELGKDPLSDDHTGTDANLKRLQQLKNAQKKIHLQSKKLMMGSANEVEDLRDAEHILNEIQKKKSVVKQYKQSREAAKKARELATEKLQQARVILNDATVTEADIRKEEKLTKEAAQATANAKRAKEEARRVEETTAQAEKDTAEVTQMLRHAGEYE